MFDNDDSHFSQNGDDVMTGKSKLIKMTQTNSLRILYNTRVEPSIGISTELE